MTQTTFTQEELEKFNPALKKMREHQEKAKKASRSREDPEKLKDVQQDICKAYDLLVVSDDVLEGASPPLASRYLASLEKLKGDREALMAASTCQKAALPLKQFQGKSQMTLGLLDVLEASIDHALFKKLVDHSLMEQPS